MQGPVIKVQSLTMGYGGNIIQKDLTFEVPHGKVTVIMGASGCGKSTLLRHMVGLMEPKSGHVFYWGRDFWKADEATRLSILRRIGVLYQNGALWSSMTLAENIALPLREFTRLTEKEIQELVSLKLALVGLAGFEDFYPSELSGGMRKRAAVARAIALDPEILFFDEPSAGLDPVSARRLDDLILELKEGLGATIVVVTHELDSIFAIGDHAIYLDSVKKTITAIGHPKVLLAEPPNDRVREFLTRGGSTIQEV